jgi:hypothetical protein
MSTPSEFRIPGPSQRFDSIDDEIFADIELVGKRRFSALYSTERYKYKKHSIEILVPKLDYTQKTVLLKDADHVRFLLSLYPDKRDLDCVEKIILRPRHIENNRIELMALFLRAKKTLVLYLFAPHAYDITASRAAEYNEFIPFDSARMINRANGSGRDSDMMVPPLLYIISMLGHSGNEIDKFFVRAQDQGGDRVLVELDEISEFYRKNGY